MWPFIHFYPSNFPSSHRTNTLKWMGRITNWVMSRMNETMSHIWSGQILSEWVMSQIQMSHVTHLHESCHTFEWVLSRMRRVHINMLMCEVAYKQVISHMHESCHTCEGGTSRLKCHVTHEWVISHMKGSWSHRMRHATRCEWFTSYMDEWPLCRSHATYKQVMSNALHVWTSNVTCDWFISHTNLASLMSTWVIQWRRFMPACMLCRASVHIGAHSNEPRWEWAHAAQWCDAKVWALRSFFSQPLVQCADAEAPVCAHLKYIS